MGKTVSRNKNPLLPAIISEIDTESESLTQIQFKPIVTADHKHWNCEDQNCDTKEMGLLGTEFRVALSLHNYNIDSAFFQFPDFKKKTFHVATNISHHLQCVHLFSNHTNSDLSMFFYY